MVVRRLFPEPGLVEPIELVRAAGLGDPDDGGPRPRVVLNMVATVDGRAALAGRTAGMGNAADRALFHALRAEADAVLVGAGTARAERYGRVIKDPEVRERRMAAGRSPDPLLCVASRGLGLPEDLPAFGVAEQRIVLLTPADGELPPVAAQVDYLRSAGQGFEPLLHRLEAEHGVRLLLCEGGPTLNAALLREGLVHELFLSLAAVLAGGEDPLTIVRGAALPTPLELDLRWVLEHEGQLFVRYGVRRPISHGRR